MKAINVSTKTHKNVFAIVDDEDFNLVSGFKWSAEKRKNVMYALRIDRSEESQKIVRMHQQIMGTVGAGKSVQVDHADRNGLNNTRSNLRLANQAQNAWNTTKRVSMTSKYKGVSRHSQNGSWATYIKFNCRHINIGSFDSEEIAAAAYNYAAKRLHRDFALINDVEDIPLHEIEAHRKKKPGRLIRTLVQIIDEVLK